MKVHTYTLAGKKGEDTTLPKDMIANLNVHLLAQAVRVFENRQHQGLAKVQTRGVMDRSTRKIYKQKGTGGARHGSRMAPIFVGGGIAHGPTGVKRTLSMPQKMRAAALSVALGVAAKEGKLVVVNGFAKLGKTGEAKKLVESIKKEVGSEKREARFTFVLSEKNLGNIRYLRNLKSVDILPYRNLNAYAVFRGGMIVVDSEALGENKEQGTKNREQKMEKVEKSVSVKDKVKKEKGEDKNKKSVATKKAATKKVVKSKR